MTPIDVSSCGVALTAAIVLCTCLVGRGHGNETLWKLLGKFVQRPLGQLQMRLLKWCCSVDRVLYVHSDGAVESLRQLPVQKVGSVRCVCVSDTHLGHRALRLPPGDVLLHGGDILLESHCADPASLSQLTDFNAWIREQPFRHKLCIAGNHDGALLELGVEGTRRHLDAATYLQDTCVIVAGLRIHGTPLSVGVSHNSAFQPQAGYDELAALRKIQAGLDILMTHGPAGSGPGTLGRASALLEEHVRQVKPAYHVCGHLHTRWGVVMHDYGTLLINASSANALYAVARPPIVFDAVPRTSE